MGAHVAGGEAREGTYVPRRLRRCKLCFGEVEDARHVLFRCPAYGRQREAMAVETRAQATPRVVGAMKSVVRQYK